MKLPELQELFPFFYEDELFGLLEVYSSSPIEEYQDQKIMLYLEELFALLANVKIREDREKALLEANRDNWMLYWGTVYANSAETFIYAAGEVAQLICNVMEWECGVIYRISAEEKLKYVKGVENENEALVISPLSEFDKNRKESAFEEIRRTLVQEVIDTGEPLYSYVLSDSSTAEGLGTPKNSKKELEGFHEKLLKETGASDMFVFPVIIEDKVEAILEFFTKDSFNPEKRKALDHITTVLMQLGFVLQREQNAMALVDKEKEIIEIKQNVFSMVVHDLKNPIGALEAMFYCWKNNEDLLNDKVFSSQLELAEISLTSLQHLVHEQLALKQIQDGKFVLNCESTDLNKLVHALYIQQQHNFHEDLLFHYEVAPEIPLFLLDKELLKRVLTNLLENAIKFTIQGSITLQCRYDETEQIIILTIKDTGAGISKEHIEHLFDMHFQSKQKLGNKDNYGIGLAFCWMAIKEMGGVISVESSLGIGTEFTLLLPASKAPEGGLCEQSEFIKNPTDSEMGIECHI